MDVRGAVRGSAALPGLALPDPAHAEDGPGGAPAPCGPCRRADDVGHQGLRHQLEAGRDTRCRAGVRRRARAGGRIGLQVEQDAEQLGARDAVDGAVVHLGHQGDLAVLEPLDHPHLPQGAVPVQLAAGDVGREVAQLAHAARRRQGGPPEVVVDVELGVVDPDGVAQAQRDLHQTALEDGDLGDPIDDHLADAPERVAVGHGRGVEDGRPWPRACAGSASPCRGSWHRARTVALGSSRLLAEAGALHNVASSHRRRATV